MMFIMSFISIQVKLRMSTNSYTAIVVDICPRAHNSGDLITIAGFHVLDFCFSNIVQVALNVSENTPLLN